MTNYACYKHDNGRKIRGSRIIKRGPARAKDDYL